MTSSLMKKLFLYSADDFRQFEIFGEIRSINHTFLTKVPFRVLV